jgi:hypothetical protein
MMVRIAESVMEKKQETGELRVDAHAGTAESLRVPTITRDAISNDAPNAAGNRSGANVGTGYGRTTF